MCADSTRNEWNPPSKLAGLLPDLPGLAFVWPDVAELIRTGEQILEYPWFLGQHFASLDPCKGSVGINESKTDCRVRVSDRWNTQGVAALLDWNCGLLE
jgi:hypothetical protein